MNKSKRYKIFERFREQNPHPVVELDHNSPFELLVAVMLSAQATDVGVNKATKKLFAIANTPEEFLKLNEEGLKPYIKSIGLYKTKAHNLIKTCEKLLKDFNGEVPNTREQLVTLPGIGRKSANVILNSCFNKPTIAVDTHVFRVSQRIGLATGKTPLEIELQLLKTIDKKFIPNVSNWLVLHGRYICIARKPRCSECIIQDLCEYKFKTLLSQSK